MANNKYVGARYVPLIADKAWSSDNSYEPLTIVQHEGNSYTSRCIVPVGIDISNNNYWVCTGNYNAQVEQYRTETQKAVDNVNQKLNNFSNEQDGKFTIMMDDYKNQINKYTDQKYTDINTQIKSLNKSISDSNDDLSAKMTATEEKLKNTSDSYTETINNQYDRIQELLKDKSVVLDAGTPADTEADDLTIYDGGAY